MGRYALGKLGVAVMWCAVSAGVGACERADSGGLPAAPADGGAGAAVDSGPADSGAADSGAADSGAPDSGAADSGTSDSGAVDSGAADSGAADSGARPDAAAPDAGGGCVGCGALAFDGIDDRVVIGDLTPAAMPNMTFEAWVFRTRDSSEYQTIFGDDDGGYDRGLVIKDARVYAWAGREFDSGLTSTLNTWEHFAVVFTATAVRVFKDGGTPFVGAGPGASSSVQPAALGAMESRWRFGFRGQLDEVRIWNVARSDAEVQAGAHCAMSGSAPGLWASYHLDQGVGGSPNPGRTTASDDSGGGHDGNLVGFALRGTSSNWTAPGAPAETMVCR